MKTKKNEKPVGACVIVESSEARAVAAVRILQLASLWAKEAASRSVLSSRSHRLLMAVKRYEALS